MSRALVLLSSGLDSTVNLYWARKEHEVPLALTFNYGQRAASKEVERSRQICELLAIPHRVVDLDFFGAFKGSALMDREKTVPRGDELSLDDLEVSRGSAERVWVANRNGVLLNVAAAFAENLGSEFIVPGFNIEEGATFPDNTEEFLGALNESLRFSTQGRVRAKCFTTGLTKREIVLKGRDLGVPFELLWPCYFDGETVCGECESCRRFFRAYENPIS